MNMLTCSGILVLVGTSIFGQERPFRGDWHCKGVKSISTEMTSIGPSIKSEESKDEIWLSRRGSFLLLQINPQEAEIFQPRRRREMQKPELFKIVGETGEGVTATYVSPTMQTSQRTFIWRADHSRALLSEVVFSFFPPQSEPLNEAIAFTCKGAE